MTETEKIINLLDNLKAALVADAPQKQDPTEPIRVEMLTVKECAETVSGLSTYAIRKLVAQDKIPYVRVGERGGKILIPKAALLDYLKIAS